MRIYEENSSLYIYFSLRSTSVNDNDERGGLYISMVLSEVFSEV